MVAPTFTNLSFELDGTGDALSPDGWTSGSVFTAEEQATWDTGATPKPSEDFENLWNTTSTVGSALLVSNSEPYSLTDRATLELSAGGAAAELVVLNTADFVDITSASATEVADVIIAQTTLTVETVLGRVVLKSSPFGDAVEVVGQSDANEALGFPKVISELRADGVDTEIAAFSGGVSDNAEQFEEMWAGLSAKIITTSGETFNVSNAQTLDIQVDNGATQVVTFAAISVGGSATALEILTEINAQTTGLLASSANTTQVQLVSDTVGEGSQIAILGGTAATALAFTPSTGSFIEGNSPFFTSLPSSNPALWNTTTDQVETFEREHDSNESFTWILTTDVVYIKAFAVGNEYTVTLISKGAQEQHTVTAIAGDTVDSIATKLAAQVSGDSSLVTASAATSPARVQITRSDNRTELSVLVSVVDTAGASVTNAMTTGADPTSAAISAALFDGETAEDFEDGYLNDPSGPTKWIWGITDNQIHIQSDDFVPSIDYVVTIVTADGSNNTTHVFTANDATAAGVAGIFALDIGNSATFDVFSFSGQTLSWTTADSRTRVVSVSGNHPALRLGAEQTSALLDEALFRNVGDVATTEQFESFGVDETGSISDPSILVGANVIYQHSVEVTNAQAGRYSIFINGNEFFFDATGGSTITSIAAALRSAITTGGGPFFVEAVTQGGTEHVRIRSTSVPVTSSDDIGVQTDAPTPSDLVATEPVVFETDNWTWGAFLRTLP